MAYEPQVWADDKAGGTPLSAERLNHLEAGVAAAHEPHTHSASDIGSGTLAAGRIPTLSLSKVNGLQAALEGKADAADLAALVSRVEALEALVEDV